MQRLASVVETSGLRTLTGPTGEKHFIGNLTGNQFSFRRWRWRHNTLASFCFGKVEPDGSGSVITGNIGGKYGCFLAFAIVFVVMAIIVPVGIVGSMTFFMSLGPPDAEVTRTLRMYWIGVAILPILVAAFHAGFFWLGRRLTRPDEAEMAALFPSLFADVILSGSTTPAPPATVRPPPLPPNAPH